MTGRVLQLPIDEAVATELNAEAAAKAPAPFRIMGLDLSLTRTGIALPSGSVGVLVPPKGHDRGMPRLAWIREQVYQLALQHRIELVLIEGYAMGMGRDAHNHAMGELGGIVRMRLFERSFPYVDVPPATLKKYATGKGNAKKEFVLVEAVKRLGYVGSDNNEADALWLWHMGLDAYSTSPHRTNVVPLPADRRELLLKISWPEIRK